MLLDWFGIFVFAASGAIEAGRARMDYVGVLAIGFVTALGGGTLRELFLGASPVWVHDSRLLVVALLGATVTFVVARFIAISFRSLLIADAIGLAVFVVAGTETAINAGVDSLVVIFMGMTTGIVGGVIRDVLCNEVPLIFRKDIYASAAFLGSLSYLLAERWFGVSFVSVCIAMAVVLLIRLLVIFYGWSLPAILRTDKFHHHNK